MRGRRGLTLAEVVVTLVVVVVIALVVAWFLWRLEAAREEVARAEQLSGELYRAASYVLSFTVQARALPLVQGDVGPCIHN